VVASEDIIDDLDATIATWNRGAEELFGYAPDEIIGKSVTILIPADRQEEEPEILKRVGRGERLDLGHDRQCRGGDLRIAKDRDARPAALPCAFDHFAYRIAQHGPRLAGFRAVGAKQTVEHHQIGGHLVRQVLEVVASTDT
jgi:PAS domain-containing protein